MIGVGPESVEEAPLITRTEPEAVAGIENVVPETVTAFPGATVCPGATTNAVVPLTMEALILLCVSREMTGVGPENVEIAPFTTKTEPDADEGMENVVPETVTAVPGASVCPGATTKAVVPPTMEAPTLLCVLPTVRAGGEALSVEVAPFATKIEPAPDVGIEYVVPETVTIPPGVRVSDRPRTNSVVPPTMLAGIGCPPIERVGFSVIAGGVGVMAWVVPSTMSSDPPPDVGTITVAPLIVVVCPTLSV